MNSTRFDWFNLGAQPDMYLAAFAMQTVSVVGATLCAGGQRMARVVSDKGPK